MRSRIWLCASGLIVAAGIAFAGCGSSKGSDVSQTPTSAGSQTGTTAAAAAGAVRVKMADYSFTPKDLTVKAGDLNISAPNDGQLQHELVVLKTDQSAASLPVNGDEVDEEGLEAKGVENAGEIEEVGPGQTKSGSFKLAPGKYVMICNLPGHYQRGMYGTITVK